MLLVQQRPDDIVRVGIDTDELSVTKAESKVLQQGQGRQPKDAPLPARQGGGD